MDVIRGLGALRAERERDARGMRERRGYGIGYNRR